MIRFTVVSFALVVLLAPAKSAVAQTVYEEGNFDLATWTVFGPFITPEENLGGGDFDVEAPTSGGNPDGYLRLKVTGVAVELGTSSLVWALLINDDAEYEPGTPGAIERVDFDFDARLPPGARGNRAVTIALEQDGFVWAAIDKRLFVDDMRWVSKWIFGLEAADFTTANWGEQDQPVNPDFSDTASPIKFGIAQGQSCPVASDCRISVQLELDIDNWKVAVNGTGLSLKLSLMEESGPGQLEVPLEFQVKATVRNAGPSEASDIVVRFLLPKESLAGFFIPDTTCRVGEEMGVPISDRLVIADCDIPGPVGPASAGTVDVPTIGIMAAGYANVVRDKSTFTYDASILSFAGDPGPVVTDEVVIAICNPSGIDPIVVNDPMTCDGNGGTSGSGGAGGGAGTGGTDMGGNGGGCDIATTSGPAPWLLILCLAGAALWLRRRYRHT